MKNAISSSSIQLLHATSLLTFVGTTHGFFSANDKVSMLSEDESDAEVMQRLAPLSRSIQDFIAASLGVANLVFGA